MAKHSSKLLNPRRLHLQIASTLLLALLMQSANAGAVRFYKATKHEGDKRIRVSDEDQAGCHTMRWRGARIYRVAVINYQYCTVHTEKECTAESIIPATWRGSEYRRADIDITAPQEKLLHGTEWILGEENIKAKSWRCVE